jgi:hypothetical protein
MRGKYSQIHRLPVYYYPRTPVEYVCDRDRMGVERVERRVTPQTLRLHVSPQQPAYIRGGAPSLRTTGDHLRLHPKSVDLEERCAGLWETSDDSTEESLRDLRRESVRGEEEGAMFVATAMTKPE